MFYVHLQILTKCPMQLILRASLHHEQSLDYSGNSNASMLCKGECESAAQFPGFLYPRASDIDHINHGSATSSQKNCT
jgi:hypothetical protein